MLTPHIFNVCLVQLLLKGCISHGKIPVQRAHLWTLTGTWMCWILSDNTSNSVISASNSQISGLCAEIFNPLVRKGASPRVVIIKVAPCSCSSSRFLSPCYRTAGVWNTTSLPAAQSQVFAPGFVWLSVSREVFLWELNQRSVLDILKTDGKGRITSCKGHSFLCIWYFSQHLNSWISPWVLLTLKDWLCGSLNLIEERFGP